MSLQRSPLGLRNFIVAIVIGMVVLGASVVAGVNFAVDRAVSADAQARAEDWAKYFIDTLPDLDALLAGAKLNAQQQAVVATAAKVGNVFRFKLYNPKGATMLQSDSEEFGKDDDGDHLEDEVFDVVKDKRASVALNDGTRERDMPALYAEAYVPVLKADGSLRAIAETYVDETRTAEFFKTSFTTLAAALGLGIALAFGIPTLAYLLRTREAHEVRSRAEYLASHDPMTSLLNRQSFGAQLGARILSDGETGVLAVAMFDIDDFKTINDTHGRAAGDAVLKHVAGAIVSAAGERDFVARAGGDQFLMALSRPTPEAAWEAIEAILDAVREPISVGGARIVGRMSAGLTATGEESESADTVIHRAEVALYQAKINGKNGIETFTDELEAQMRARRELERLLQEATADHRFELYYQPLLAANTKTCIGFEALLRLRDGAGAHVPPMTFIPVAEALGLIDEIGTWALREATRTAALWPEPLFVSVNLSVRQFASGQLVDHVENALAASGLAPSRLELEVTESLLMENTESVARQLKALKALGVSIAMDDFGTGYSSLGYLWQFGFDKLKIDRSFIAALDVDPRKAREILDTIVVLAHKLDMQVTAEGIETEGQAAVLSALACDQFQGYLYGRPAAADSIAPLLLREVAAGKPAERSKPVAASA